MKKLAGLLLVASLGLLPAVRAYAAPMTIDEAGEKYIGLIEGIATIVDTDKADCDKMATDLTKYENDNAALLKNLKEMKNKGTEAEKTAVKEKYKARFQAAMQKMGAGGQACQANDKVKAAFSKMRG